MTCYEMLVKNCDKKKGCIVFFKHRLSINKFIKNIDDFAYSLKKLGFKKGDVLTLYLPTCPQALVGFYACSKLGVVANIVHPMTPLEKLKENLQEVKSKGLMYYDILVKEHKDLKTLNQILINCSISNYFVFRKLFYYIFARTKHRPCKGSLAYSKLIYHNPNNKSEVEIEGAGSDIVCTMHSGGTSGKPKIVALQNDALNELSVSLEKMYTRKERGGGSEYSLVALPIFHAYGLGVAVHTCLTNKYSLILTPTFSPKNINNLIREYNVTFFVGVPVMFKKMLEQKNFYGKHLAKLRDLWCGGDVLHESFVEHFDTVMKRYGSSARLFRGYGLTEVSSVCAANTFEHYRKNSCGKAIPNTKIEIWDDDGNVLKPKTIGEIVVQSPSVMKYYIDDKDGFVIKDNEKWIRTGDVGYMDCDGYLYVLDRKKRSVKINAINVFPAEVETVAKQHKLVDEACAVFYHYNEKTYIKLYVTLKKTTSINEEKLKKEIIVLCEKNLMKYSVPRLVEIIDEMPRTNMGKIDYKKFNII